MVWAQNWQIKQFLLGRKKNSCWGAQTNTTCTTAVKAYSTIQMLQFVTCACVGKKICKPSLWLNKCLTQTQKVREPVCRDQLRFTERMHDMAYDITFHMYWDPTEVFRPRTCGMWKSQTSRCCVNGGRLAEQYTRYIGQSESFFTLIGLVVNTF